MADKIDFFYKQEPFLSSYTNTGVIRYGIVGFNVPLNTLAVWLSGNMLASINVVALRQTRLVLRWVTVCGRVNHIGM